MCNEVYIINNGQHVESADSSDDMISRRAYVNFTISAKKNAKMITALYDTGASVSLMTPKDFEKIKQHGTVLEKFQHHCGIINASQKPMATEGAFRVRLFLNGKYIPACFIVSPEIHTSIIGMNIITAHGLTLDPVTFKVRPSAPVSALSDTEFKEDPDTLLKPIAEVRTLKATTIHSRTGQLTRFGLFDPNGQRILREVDGIVTVEQLTAAVKTDQNGAFSIHIPNATAQDNIIPKGRAAGKFYSLNDWAPVNANEAKSKAEQHAKERPLRPHTKEEKAKIKDVLSAQIQHIPYLYRQDYLEMLCQREHFFSADSHDLGFTELQEHVIDTEDKKPVFSPQFRLPAEHLQMIQENVAGWLRSGIVERSKSPYNSPIFCVPKKAGLGLRCVLDYRRLNGKSTEDRYSIRTIDECLEAIGRADSKIFSCLDLTNGYWQLNLRRSDRHLTAFTIPGKGQYQWVTTPQGLMGAPASFSRLMDMIMADAENVITYIDDVLCHSKDHPQHISHLASAIDRIGRCNLRLNPNKCIFGATEVEYLGHTITSKGVQPGKDKAAVVKSARPPTTTKELKSFLGLANYFRNYIVHFSQKAAPLFKLTRQDSKWKSGTLPPDALAAFERLRHEVSSRPVMAYPRREGRFHLYVDAALGDSKNEGGLGAVLLQDQPNGLQRPIAYASRRLQTHERNYPAFLAEMQAACYGMEEFHHLLTGRRFFLYTDHKPLTRLSTVHTKTLNRLQLKMQDLHPVIKFVDGKENSIADFLSRYHGMNVSTDKQVQRPDSNPIAIISHSPEGLPLAMIDASPYRIRALQRLDDNLKDVCKYVLENTAGSTREEPKTVELRRQTLTMFNGVLYVKVPNRAGIISHSPWRVVTPRAMRREILAEAHNSSVGGHGGQFKTAERIKADFWWKNMDADIADHVSTCTTCQAATNKGLDGLAPLQPLPAPTGPNKRVHIDLFGPLTSSESGNNFIMVITDAFSKFAIAKPIKGKAAHTVADAILQHLYVFGVPERIQTDQGLEFCNELERNLWDSLNIQHDVTTPYHPQCNAGAEVFNKTLKHYLATAIIDAEASTLDWQLYIGPLMFSYNTAVSSTTKVTPFDALFGYDPRAPLWSSEYLEPNANNLKNASFQDYLHQIRKAQAATRNIVHHNNQHTRQQYKDAHDRNAMDTAPDYQPGDLVWARINDRRMPNQKIFKKWEKAVIVSRATETTFVVKREGRKRNKLRTLNYKQLKARTPDAQPPPAPQEEEEEGQLPPEDDPQPDNGQQTEQREDGQQQEPTQDEHRTPPQTDGEESGDDDPDQDPGQEDDEDEDDNDSDSQQQEESTRLRRRRGRNDDHRDRLERLRDPRESRHEPRHDRVQHQPEQQGQPSADDEPDLAPADDPRRERGRRTVKPDQRKRPTRNPDPIARLLDRRDRTFSDMDRLERLHDPRQSIHEPRAHHVQQQQDREGMQGAEEDFEPHGQKRPQADDHYENAPRRSTRIRVEANHTDLPIASWLDGRQLTHKQWQLIFDYLLSGHLELTPNIGFSTQQFTQPAQTAPTPPADRPAPTTRPEVQYNAPPGRPFTQPTQPEPPSPPTATDNEEKGAKKKSKSKSRQRLLRWKRLAHKKLRISKVEAHSTSGFRSSN